MMKPRGRFICLLPLLGLVCLFAVPVAGQSLPDQTAYVTGASHIDLEWKWRFAEAVGVCQRTFGAVLDIMDDYDEHPGGNPVYYSQSQALAYKEMEERYPDLFARIAARVAEGRWEIVGGMWVESDANLPGGESFVRQLFYGKQYFRDRFGVDVKTGWLPDSFGYNGNLPQFFRRAGIDNFFYYKTNWNDTHPPKVHNFWWEAADGSRIVAHLAWGMYNNQVFAWSLRKVLNEAAQGDPDQPGILFPIGMGDHGGGIGRRNINLAVALAEDGWPIHFGPAANFFAALDYDQLTDVIATELYLEFHRGAYTSRSKHKQDVRGLEYGLMGAESVCALAALEEAEYPTDALVEAWQALMLDEFHDTMAGTCLEVVYAEDAAERNAAAFEIIADEESAALAHLLGGEVSTEFGGDGWFVVFNPLGFVVTAPVLIPVPKGQVNSRAVYAPDGSPVKCQIDHDGGGLWIIAEAVPAYGWRVYGLAAGSPGGDAPYPADVTHLENAHLTVRLAAPTGLLKSLVAKDLGGREFIDSEQAGNLLQIYHDKPDVFDSWDIGFDKYHDEPIEELREADDIELIESGPVRSVVRVTRHSQYETYWQDVIVYYDLPRVDFATHVFDWGTEAHRFLKAAFPLDLVNDGRLATSEMPYGTITRVLDGSVAYTELPGHKWTDIAENFGADRAAGPGLALLARDKYGYDVANDGPGEGLSDGRTNVLRLSLLKSATSPRYLLPEQGGPITDRGDFVVHYALYPHDGDARDANVYRYGHEYYAPLVVRFVGDAEPPARDAFAVTTPGNALLVWLKRPEVAPQNGEVLLRVVESVGQDVTAQVRLPEHRILAATRVNLLEEPEDDPVVLTDERTAEFALGAHEILTLRLQVETAPADDDDDDTESPDENPADDGGCGC